MALFHFRAGLQGPAVAADWAQCLPGRELPDPMLPGDARGPCRPKVVRRSARCQARANPPDGRCPSSGLMFDGASPRPGGGQRGPRAGSMALVPRPSLHVRRAHTNWRCHLSIGPCAAPLDVCRRRSMPRSRQRWSDAGVRLTSGPALVTGRVSGKKIWPLFRWRNDLGIGRQIATVGEGQRVRLEQVWYPCMLPSAARRQAWRDRCFQRFQLGFQGVLPLVPRRARHRGGRLLRPDRPTSLCVCRPSRRPAFALSAYPGPGWRTQPSPPACKEALPPQRPRPSLLIPAASFHHMLHRGTLACLLLDGGGQSGRTRGLSCMPVHRDRPDRSSLHSRYRSISAAVCPRHDHVPRTMVHCRSRPARRFVAGTTRGFHSKGKEPVVAGPT